MSVYTYILISTIIFILIIYILVAMLLGVKAKLLPSGPVKILINEEKEIEVNSGSTLLSTLGDNKVFLPSACGGGGTCVQCKCIVSEGGGEILPTEKPHFSRKEIKEGWRLGCQVKVKENMNIHVPEEVFGIKKYEAKVVRNYNVASFIKEFVVEIPEEMNYKAGVIFKLRFLNVKSIIAILILLLTQMNIQMILKNLNLSGINLVCGI